MRCFTLNALIPKTEQECADRLAELRWGLGGLVCDCGGRGHRRIETRPRVFVCRSCRCHTSVTAGTLMHGCHVPLRHWFIAATLLARRGGCAATELQRKLEVTYETAWQLLHRLRAGVQNPCVRVVGRLVLSAIRIQTNRPYRDGGRPTLPHFSVVAAVAGDNGVRLSHVPSFGAVADWSGEVELPMSREGPAVLALWTLKLQVKRTHVGISERWLRRYMGEVQYRENTVACDFLAQSIGAARRRFVDLRPPFEGWPDEHPRAGLAS